MLRIFSRWEKSCSNIATRERSDSAAQGSSILFAPPLGFVLPLLPSSSPAQGLRMHLGATAGNRSINNWLLLLPGKFILDYICFFYTFYSPASKLPESNRASWCADRSSGNQAEESKDSTMLAIPTVRVLRSVSGADEELIDEAGALLGCEILDNRGTVSGDIRCVYK